MTSVCYDIEAIFREGANAWLSWEENLTRVMAHKRLLWNRANACGREYRLVKVTTTREILSD